MWVGLEVVLAGEQEVEVEPLGLALGQGELGKLSGTRDEPSEEVDLP